MTNRLKELTNLNGLTMKQLAKRSHIPYTTLISMSETSIKGWSNEKIRSISESLNLLPSSFKKEINKGVPAPFIKWVGGKRQLLPTLTEYLPEEGFNRYFEPFIGGGALFLREMPNQATINDLNEELVNAWKIVKNNLPALKENLLINQEMDSKEFYIDVRKADRDGRILKMTDVERAARFIYLNKAGFNGLWRVNSKGQNNVPYGSHKTLNLLPETLDHVSSYLNKNDIKITYGDYKETVKEAKNNDFVYFDPPYIPINPSSSFTSYTKNGFGLFQQEELRDISIQLTTKGVKVMLSNSDTKLTNELYKNKIFNIHHVSAKRSINSDGSKRGKVGEVIITNY